jgi:hypothetical protein
MNLEKVSAIAEIVSSIAILITLGYLAIETNQNTGAINSSSHQQLLNSDLDLIRELRDEPEITQALLVGEVPPEEAFRIAQFLMSFMRIREFAYLQYREGRMDEYTWNSYANVTKFMYSTDWAKEMFENQVGGASYDPDFVEAMRELVYEDQ